jgi:hypothetical protein
MNSFIFTLFFFAGYIELTKSRHNLGSSRPRFLIKGCLLKLLLINTLQASIYL